jgi:hypothetical protein
MVAGIEDVFEIFALKAAEKMAAKVLDYIVKHPDYIVEATLGGSVFVLTRVYG